MQRFAVTLMSIAISMFAYALSPPAVAAQRTFVSTLGSDANG